MSFALQLLAGPRALFVLGELGELVSSGRWMERVRPFGSRRADH